MKNLPFIMKKVIEASLRSVKLRVLASEDMANIYMELFKKLNGPDEALQNIEMRIEKNLSKTIFTIIDSEKVVLHVDDPTDPSNTLAVTTMWDQKLANKLEEKFNDMWEEAEQVDIK